MADKLTLLELHMHAEDNEFENGVELSSDIGELLRNRLGFGSADEETTTDEFDIDDSGNDSLSASGTTADGGDAMELGEESEETESAVVEIDRDSDLVDDEADDNEEDEGGRSWGRTLLVVVLLVAVVYLARSYLGGDDFEDKFEEL